MGLGLGLGPHPGPIFLALPLNSLVGVDSERLEFGRLLATHYRPLVIDLRLIGTLRPQALDARIYLVALLEQTPVLGGQLSPLEQQIADGLVGVGEQLLDALEDVHVEKVVGARGRVVRGLGQLLKRTRVFVKATVIWHVF